MCTCRGVWSCVHVEVFGLCGSCFSLSIVSVGSKLFKKNKIGFWTLVISGVFFPFYFYFLLKN